jgi:hypothetical protein
MLTHFPFPKPDIWQMAQNFVDYSQNGRGKFEFGFYPLHDFVPSQQSNSIFLVGKMTADQLYTLIVKRQHPNLNNNAFGGFGQNNAAMIHTLDHTDVAAYVLAMIRVNLGQCTQN